MLAGKTGTRPQEEFIRWGKGERPAVSGKACQGLWFWTHPGQVRRPYPGLGQRPGHPGVHLRREPGQENPSLD